MHNSVYISTLKLYNSMVFSILVAGNWSYPVDGSNT